MIRIGLANKNPLRNRLSARTRRLFTAFTLVPIASLALMSCSTSDTETKDGDEPPHAVTIEHQFGSTTINGVPKRVVTIWGNWTDTLVALDVPITAEFRIMNLQGEEKSPWTPDHESTVHKAATMLDINAEAIAEYNPDLILAGWVGPKTMYDQLSKLAPVIPVIDQNAIMDTWEQLLETGGKIFDKEDRADELTEQVKSDNSEYRKKHSAAQGKTVSFGQLSLDQQIAVVADPSDPAARILQELGLELDPKVLAAAEGNQRVGVSQENLSVISSDVLVAWSLTEGGRDDFRAIPGWSDLPAVKNDRTIFVDNVTSSAFSYPSVYSLAFVREMLEPALSTFD